MSTSYTLYNDKYMELCIIECSNMLEIVMFDNIEENALRSQEMSPSDMLKLLLEGVKSVSYWMEEKEFNNILEEAEFFPYRD